MGNYIVEIANYVWVITILLILAAIFLRLDKSSLISLVVWIVAELIMARLAPIIVAIEDNLTSQHVWYVTWIIFDTVCIALLFIIHKHLNIAASKLSVFIATSFITLLFLQAARYVDRLVLETNSLIDIYKFCVPAIQFSVPLMAIVWFLKTIHAKHKQHRELS
ncbi:hypothetical protein J8L98_23175 [Pseudoalteromonas sp. MMG013]|uniref:hypothetical protein n=1 Tax=Pseudoalteromonas sp. MMG013 TaxID=2822687 RepID=UPI001B385A7F|nr:hypothetical protein [Pseudoalteromonas sp. MMG013]MBQ4864589.1 hypothetical protein [Pseudoalteromonas sp. MMG013]